MITEALAAPESDQLSVYRGRIAALLDVARAHKIGNAETREMAINLRSQIKAVEKKTEEYRQFHVKPLSDQVKRINDSVRPLKEVCEQADGALEKEQVRDRQEQIRIAEEARRKAEEERRRLEAQADAERLKAARVAAEVARKEALAAGLKAKEAREYGALHAQDEMAKPIVIPITPALAVTLPPAKTVTTDAGARSTAREEWDVEVTDLDQVPVKYLKRELRKAEVLLDVRAGLRDVPGLKIFPVTRISR